MQAAEDSARKKTSEVLGQARFRLSQRALLQRQRAARKAIEVALAKSHGERDARKIAFHLSQWLEEAAFLVALSLDPKKFSKAEVEAGVSSVLTNVLDDMWDAALVAGYPLPCLDDETIDFDDNDDDS
jgi:hypothetical protein